MKTLDIILPKGEYVNTKTGYKKIFLRKLKKGIAKIEMV